MIEEGGKERGSPLVNVYCVSSTHFLSSLPSFLSLCPLPACFLSFCFTQLSYITAFLGGIHLATYTSSLWLQLCRRLTENTPHKTLFIASLTYLTLISLAAVEGRVLGVSLLDCCLFFALCLMGGSLKHWMVFVESTKKPRRPSKPVNFTKVSSLCDIWYHFISFSQ